MTGAAILTPIQIVVGDWAARMVATDQPTKLAAMEGLATTARGAPEALGGYFSGGHLHDALKIPDGLSILAKLNPQCRGENRRRRPGLVDAGAAGGRHGGCVP